MVVVLWGQRVDSAVCGSSRKGSVRERAQGLSAARVQAATGRSQRCFADPDQGNPALALPAVRNLRLQCSSRLRISRERRKASPRSAVFRT